MGTITINIDDELEQAIHDFAERMCGSKAALCKRWVIEGYILAQVRGDYTLWQNLNTAGENGLTGKKGKK